MDAEEKRRNRVKRRNREMRLDHISTVREVLFDREARIPVVLYVRYGIES
jgi:hypothetical protein